MDPERIRSSVIARLAGFDDQWRLFQTAAKKHGFLSGNYQPKVATNGSWGKRHLSKLDQEKMRALSTCKREKQISSLVSTGNKKSSSSFLATPTKELFRAYVQKPTSLASKHVSYAQSTPPHKRGNGMKSIHREIANHRDFGARVGQQSSASNLKPKYQNRVNPVKPRIRKKENSMRCFSPVSAPTGCDLGDRKRRQFLSGENKAKERKKSEEKEKYPWEVVSNSTASFSRDPRFRLGEIGGETLAAEVKLRVASSPRLTSKDENVHLLNCSETHPECETRLEEANQPSPVSVLETIFDVGMLENFEKLPHLSFLGLEQQLEILKSESVESYSERSGMVVSSDDEPDEESIIINTGAKENKDGEPIGSFGVQESQDFSYTDEIFAEAGLRNGKHVLNQWDSPGLPINPTIFEKLDKKYVGHTSWRRSERRLLFDRVNSALIEILESYIAAPRWKKPVSRRLGTVLTTQQLKEELQKLLAMQDKRAKKGLLSAKMPAIDADEWLELEADVEPVVRELETVLLDELLDELVNNV